jgi:hypothetical protein
MIGFQYEEALLKVLRCVNSRRRDMSIMEVSRNPAATGLTVIVESPAPAPRPQQLYAITIFASQCCGDMEQRAVDDRAIVIDQLDNP